MNPISSLAAPLASDRGALWLRVGRMFTGRDTTTLTDAHLVYNGVSILHAGPDVPAAALLRPGQTAPDLHLPAHTVLPGLIDAHTHLFLEGGEENPARRADYLKLPEAELHARATARLSRLVAIGVIAIREAGDKAGVGLTLQARWRSASRATAAGSTMPASASGTRSASSAVPVTPTSSWTRAMTASST